MFLLMSHFGFHFLFPVQENDFDCQLRLALSTPRQTQWCSSSGSASPAPIGPVPSLHMVSSWWVHASPACIPFRDPDSFMAGEIHRHVPFWDEILRSHSRREELVSYITNGVATFIRFFGPFLGLFVDVVMTAPNLLALNSLTTVRVNSLAHLSHPRYSNGL